MRGGPVDSARASEATELPDRRQGGEERRAEVESGRHDGDPARPDARPLRPGHGPEGVERHRSMVRLVRDRALRARLLESGELSLVGALLHVNTDIASPSAASAASVLLGAPTSGSMWSGPS